MARRHIPKKEEVEIADILALVGFVFLAVAFFGFMFYNPGGIYAYSIDNILYWVLAILGIVLIAGDILFLSEQDLGHKFRRRR